MPVPRTPSKRSSYSCTSLFFARSAQEFHAIQAQQLGSIWVVKRSKFRNIFVSLSQRAFARRSRSCWVQQMRSISSREKISNSCPRPGNDDAGFLVLSLQKQLRAISVLPRVAYVSCVVDDTTVLRFCRLREERCREWARTLTQTAIDFFFKQCVWNVYRIKFDIWSHVSTDQSGIRRWVADYRE